MGGGQGAGGGGISSLAWESVYSSYPALLEKISEKGCGFPSPMLAGQLRKSPPPHPRERACTLRMGRGSGAPGWLVGLSFVLFFANFPSGGGLVSRSAIRAQKSADSTVKN